MMKKRSGIVKSGKEDRFIGFVLLLFLSGCAAGSILAPRFASCADNVLWGNGFSVCEQAGFFSSFLSTAFLLAALFPAGLCAIGQPVSFCVALYRGGALGLAAGASYISGGMKALPALAVLMIPHAVATTLILVYGIRESVGFSNMLALCCVSDKTECGLRARFRKYLLRFLVLLLLTGICAAVRTVLFAVLYKTLAP